MDFSRWFRICIQFFSSTSRFQDIYILLFTSINELAQA